MLTHKQPLRTHLPTPVVVTCSSHALLNIKQLKCPVSPQEGLSLFRSQEKFSFWIIWLSLFLIDGSYVLLYLFRSQLEDKLCPHSENKKNISASC